MIVLGRLGALVVENPVWIPHFLKINTAIGRVNVPSALNETQRKSAADSGIGNFSHVRSGRNGSDTIGQHIMAIDAAARGDREISRRRSKSAASGISDNRIG